MWASNEGGARGVRLHRVTHRKGWWQSNLEILPVVPGLCETACPFLWEREGDQGDNYFIN